MNKYKILILVAVVCGIISAVMIFSETQMSMPKDIEWVRGHADFLKMKNEIFVSISVNKPMDDPLEGMYKYQKMAIKKFVKDDLITSTEHLNITDLFIVNYSNAFVKACRNVFNDDVWADDIRSFMIARISELKSYKDSTDSSLLANHTELFQKVNEITSTCDDYVSAENVLSETSYSGISNAKANIHKIECLKEEGRLASCHRLVNAMDSYANKLGNAHYDKLVYLHDQMANWQSPYVSLSSIFEKYDNFVNIRNEYINSGACLYGSSHPNLTNDMKDDVDKYKKNAIDAKCRLTVDGYSSERNVVWDNNSDTYTFYVDTDHPEGYRVTTLSDWFNVTSKDGESFTISYSSNPGSDRTDWFDVEAGVKKVKIKIIQRAIKQSVEISSVNATWDVYQNGQYGVKFAVNIKSTDYSNSIRTCIYFYNSNKDQLTYCGCSNSSYHTSTGQSTIQHVFIPLPGVNSWHTDYLFMPYTELHVTRKGRTDLYYQVQLQSSEHKSLATSNWYGFSLTN